MSSKLLDAAKRSIELGGTTPEFDSELLALAEESEREVVRVAMALKPYWTPRELRIVEACDYCLKNRAEMGDSEAVKLAADRFKFTEGLIREHAIEGKRTKTNLRLKEIGTFRYPTKIWGEIENDDD